MSIAARLIGGVVLGAGAYAGLTVFQPELGPQIIYAVSGAMALVGLAFGAKAWEVVTHLF